MQDKRNKVFVSYSHKDEIWLSKLKTHLKPLMRENLIEVWDDKKIEPGSKWRESIDKALQDARIAILLVSAEFLASEFITQNELPPLLMKADSDGTRILSLIISPCRFAETKSISQFQSLNEPEKTLIGMSVEEQEKTFVQVTTAIEKAISQHEVIFKQPDEPDMISNKGDHFQEYMRNRTGIMKIYTSLLNCENDIKEDFKKASTICLLLQIGRRELGDGHSSLFFNLAKYKNQLTEIRILRAANDSPFMSQERAMLRGRTSAEEWQGDLNRLSEMINRLKEKYHVKIIEREHYEPFLWRMFFFDDIAYISAYIHSHGNDNNSPVYRIADGIQSQYIIFKKYYDYLWYKYDPEGPDDPIQKWRNWI